MLPRQFLHYLKLIRLDKPIGILLLLWPTLWALWLASIGTPDKKFLFIFMTGVFLMRSAGCILNDFADRHFDGYVARTCQRPFVTGKVSLLEGLSLAVVFLTCAFLLVLMCNVLTIQLAVLGAVITMIYPFLKRYISMPQLGLSVAFSWSVPMIFAAVTGLINGSAWLLFFTAAIWPLIYDTMYAMADKSDDLKIGIQSTAIFFAHNDKLMIGCFQIIFLLMLVLVGFVFELQYIYFVFLFPIAILFFYQQLLIRHRNSDQCIRAFKNNNWVGFLIFVGIAVSYLK